MARKRVETESKEILECSFKPKINNDYTLEHSRIDRFENLHKNGTKHIQNKKDRAKEEIEVEKNAKECTHKPLITNEIIDFNQKTNAFDQSSYHTFFDRLKKGRFERKQKDIIHSREPFLIESKF